MKITKHVHSCLTIEENGLHMLFDPGVYSYQEYGLDIATLDKLDYILITHEHHDHVFVPCIKELVKKFPDVTIISTPSVKKLLHPYNITVRTTGNDHIAIKETPHEPLFGQSPQNYAMTIFNRFTHPGDSLHFTKTADILAMPIQAPWGSYIQALEKAKEVKPKIVIPIHDWHWKDEARKQLYQRAEEYLKPFGIRFISIESNQPIEV